VTFALRAGIAVFAVSRFIGSSIAMIDQHYGHLANDSRNTPSRSLMHSRSSGPWTLRGRRPARQQTQCPSVFPELGRVDPAAQRTLGKRRT
jgi:hypothetical protein